ncbi:DEAD/DEAH box helicase [Haloplasma contractile]|uniref:ATP-dependent RNA helicase DbpA n=1 Tax=Haloplasma contractile SSD-17B TaxID=1033810 RepID=F7Q1Y3_9MOLU|nr:DEAD/DEAH box helicase [Haloplasma contractile]ERJ12205.1 ATP-dependent RNA helicase DbpA protein [Haloplasma contractile SSD-17B]
MNEIKFTTYNLSEDILKALELLNFSNPTKVQQEVIPVILKKQDIIVKSQTGSGKTGSFAIPLTELVEWEENKPQVLVLTPTRELAMQVKDDFFNIGRYKRLKVPAVFGKDSFEKQEKQLKQKSHVVVGTPGRTIDHIERGTIDLSEIKYLVIDEADEMLNMGFVDQIETIITNLPKDRVTMLFSATMPKDIELLCKKYMNKPLRVEIESESSAIDRITQERYEVRNSRDKNSLLNDLLVVENPDSCIIFCNTRQMVDDVNEEMTSIKSTCETIHGGMEQRDRQRVMNDFKLGYFRYLVATDVAARGIDIDDISLVINYDLPREKESYVHRIGRTGRIGREGKAITFVTRNERESLKDIEQYIERSIPVKDRPGISAVENAQSAFNKTINTRPEIREEKGAELNKDIMKIHINAGKKQKMRPVDIVGTLCNIDGVTKDDIGIINILDISTFVEILNNKGELVHKSLQKKPLKGRLRRVSKVLE